MVVLTIKMVLLQEAFLLKTQPLVKADGPLIRRQSLTADFIQAGRFKRIRKGPQAQTRARAFGCVRG